MVDKQYLAAKWSVNLAKSGSAFAEKTIDLLICRRLKLRGQNWSRKGADNIVAFRQLILNDPWETHWQQKTAG